jgi:arylsulfatase
MLYGSWAVMDKWAATLKEFPPVQRPNSFTIDEALHMLTESAGGGKQ